tara:strand:+ start:131 stop:532 length:402 start_codon:yes stop_codon:yes gene_type:complete
VGTMQKKEKINLTDAIVRKLRPEDGEWRSDITPGLLIRIRSMDSKVWYFRYRPKGKEPQKFVFGNFKILSVRGARNRVKKTYSDLLDNIDPIESRKQWEVLNKLEDANIIKLKRNGKGRLPEVKIVLAKKKLN